MKRGRGVEGAGLGRRTGWGGERTEETGMGWGGVI